MPGVLLMRGGSSFCSQLIVVLRRASLPDYAACFAGDLIHAPFVWSRATRAARAARLRGRTVLDFLDDPAADDDRVGVRGDRLRARRIADAEADADRQRDVAADLGQLAHDVRGIEVCRRRSRP